MALARDSGMELLRRVVIRPLDNRIAILCIGILALNLVDAFATLHHLEHGAKELNPFMAALLDRGIGHFLIVKHLLASVGVIGIALHPGERAAQLALNILFPLYAVLAIYQLALFCLI